MFSSFSAAQLVISECLHANAKNRRKLWQPVINHSNHWEVCSAAASVQLISPSTHLQKPLPLSGCKHIFSLQLAVLLCPLWRTNLEQCVQDVTWETSCNWIITELSYAALTCKVKRIFVVHPTRLIDSMFVGFFLLLHSILRFAWFKPFWLELWKYGNIIFLWMSSINQHLSLTNRQILTSEKPLLLLRRQKIKKTWQICQSCLPGWSTVKKKKKLQWA